MTDSNGASNRDRALMVELVFGERVPKCRNCGAIDQMYDEFARADKRCRKCQWLEANEQVLMVPKDERLRDAD